MSKKPAKLRPDAAEIAFRVMQEAIGEAPKTLPPKERREKNAEAARRGSVGGKKGGQSRARKLNAEQRRAIASAAAKKRWRKRDT